MGSDLQQRDFVISFQRRGDGLAACLMSSPAGAATEELVPPWTAAELDSLMGPLEAAVRARIVRPLHTAPKPDSTLTPEQVGTQLFDSLFRGSILEKLDASLKSLQEEGSYGLRIRLVLDPAQEDFPFLSALPWELLYRSGAREYLCRSAVMSVVRHLKVNQPSSAQMVNWPLRVLVVMAQPKGTRALDLKEERRKIEDSWTDKAFLRLQFVRTATLRELRTTLRDGRYDVVHFMGHGAIDAKSGGACLLFENARGHRHRVSGQKLADTLRVLYPPRLVVLNACDGGVMPRKEGLNPFAGVAAALVATGIRNVVAMQFPISDDAAIAFSSAFYSVLAERGPLESAVTEGRIAIMSEEEDGHDEWCTPILFLRTSEDGKAFLWPEKPTGPLTPPKLGIRTFLHKTDNLEDEVDLPLDLVPMFKGRKLRVEEDWQETVYPEVERFLNRHAARLKSLYLQLDTHTSVAFAAGYTLGTMGGRTVTIRQRTPWGSGDWELSPGGGDVLPDTPLWSEIRTIDCPGGGTELALAVSVTHDVLSDVEEWVKSEPRVGRILALSVHPKPLFTSLLNGAHAVALAQDVSGRLRERSAGERAGVLHVFLSAPNAFTFSLGRLAPGFGKVQVYEFRKEENTLGGYEPGIALPPPPQATEES